MRIRLSDLAPGVNYAVQLRSTDGTRYSDWSRVFYLLTTSDLTPPAIPTGIASSMSGTTFNVTWSAVTLSADGTVAYDLDHYDVLVASSGTGVTGVYPVKNDTKFQFTLDMNRQLFGTPRANIIFSVRSVDATGNASVYSTTTSQTNAAPAAPTGFSGAGVNDAVVLKWTGVADTDLMMYRVYSGTSSGSQTTLVWSGMGTSATIQRTDYSTDQWYKVVAVDVFNTESTGAVAGPYRPSSPFAIDTQAPLAPTGLAITLTNATDGKTAKAAVVWNAVVDTDGDLSEYIIDYKPSTETAWDTTKVDYEKTATTIVGLLPYTNYDFRIRSSDWSANLSAWSSTVTKTAAANTAPANPTGVSMGTGIDSITVAWTANTEPDMANGAGTYIVEVARDSGFTIGLLSYRTGANTITVSGLIPATTYYTRVRAVDSLGLASAGYSTTVSATTEGAPSTFKYTTAAVAPSSPTTGDIWMDTTTGFEKQWNGTGWVNTGNVSLAYTTAKGTDLVTNGTGIMGNNYNFATYFDFNGADAPTGTTGSFVDKSTAQHGTWIDELLPFDPNKSYKYSFQARQTVAGATNRLYGMFIAYDAANLQISPTMYMFQPNTTTTLAAPLNNGDTTITLTSAANWYGSAAKPATTNTHYRSMIIWGYTDSFGKTWPAHTYSRRYWLNDSWADGGITGNVITLRAPWAGGSFAAGTEVSNGSSGGSFIYMPSATNVVVPETWTTYGDTFSSGVMADATAATGRTSSATWGLGVPPGTAKIKVGWLLNYPPSPANPTVGRHAVAGVSLSDASAAYDLANASATGKNKIIHSTSAASGTTGYIAGDTWFQYNGSNQIIGQWRFSGSAWVAQTIENAVIANLDAGKMTANSAFITTLNIGAGGAIQSAGYTAGGTSGFILNTSGLTIKGTGNTVDGATVPDSTLSINAVKTSTLTATTINLGATGVINVDSTGAIKSNNWANLSTGYRLDNAGLQINDGSIDAKAFRAGSAIIGDLTIGRSADTLGEIKSFGYVANSTGFRLHKTGLEVNSGTIKAAALQLQNGHNMMPPQYADFEYGDFYYINPFWTPRGQGNLFENFMTVDTNPTVRVFGTQCLSVASFNPVAGYIRLGKTATDYNIPVDANGVYYLSAYLRNYHPTGETWTLKVIGNNGATLATQSWAHSANESTFTRRGMSVTIPASGVSSVIIELGSTTLATKAVYLDGVQFEPVIGGLVQASAWKPPAQTYIDASGVTTGFMRSNANVTVSGSPQPAWSLNKEGNMQVGDALVRGKLVVGSTSEAPVNMAPNSGNFESNVTGYSVYSVGATGTAIARTTTVGEVITGTGSAKVTAAAGSKTSLGLSFNLANTYPEGTRITLTASVKTDATAGGIYVSTWNAALGAVDTQTVVGGPLANTVYPIEYEYIVEPGDNAKTMLIFAGGTTTATSVIVDNIVVYTDNDLNSSYVSSPNYAYGSQGWRIWGDGSVEFNNALIRGTLRTAVSGQRFEIGLYDVLYGASNRILGFSGNIGEDAPGFFESTNTVNAGGTTLGLKMTSPQAFGITSPAQVSTLVTSPTTGLPRSAVTFEADVIAGYGMLYVPSMSVTEMRWTDNTSLTLANTTAVAMGARGGSGTFIAPYSGRVVISAGGQVSPSTAGQYSSIGFELREGGTVGSGTIVHAYDVNESFLGYNTEWSVGMVDVVVTGLTAGNTYNVRNIAKSGSGTTAAVLRGRIIVTMSM